MHNPHLQNQLLKVSLDRFRTMHPCGTNSRDHAEEALKLQLCHLRVCSHQQGCLGGHWYAWVQASICQTPLGAL